MNSGDNRQKDDCCVDKETHSDDCIPRGVSAEKKENRKQKSKEASSTF